MTIFRGELVRHPASPAGPVERILVTITLTADEAQVDYTLIGNMDDVVLPAVAPGERRDGLWTSTCFELFAKPTSGQAYVEWNFAPSGAWAAYQFDNYRAGMRNADVTAPVIARTASNGYRLMVAAQKPPLPCRIGLSAVIRDTDGGTSYWALAHPPGKADFHHADCFALDLPAALTR